jgi:mono/diheme cytochrome c family protein
MLSTIDFVVASLSTGHKLGLAAVGAAFILFALVSSFVLPKLNPNFPGRSVGWYVTLCVVFFAAMVSAVIVFGREKKEEAVAATTPASTSAALGTTSPKTAPGTAPQGNPQAGKAVFTSAGCVGCHTLKAAGATGTVGPNLDKLKPAYARIVLQVTNGGKIMPSFKSRLSEQQIRDVAAFVYTSTHS